MPTSFLPGLQQERLRCRLWTVPMRHSGCAVGHAFRSKILMSGANRRKKKPRFSTPGPGERLICAPFGQGLKPSLRGLPPTHRAELETAEASFKQRAPTGRSSLYLVAAGVFRARQSCSHWSLEEIGPARLSPTDPEETCQHRTQESGVAGRPSTPRPLQAVHRGFRPLQQPGGPGLLTLPPPLTTLESRCGFVDF